VEKLEGKRRLERHRHRWEGIKIYVDLINLLIEINGGAVVNTVTNLRIS